MMSHEMLFLQVWIYFYTLIFMAAFRLLGHCCGSSTRNRFRRMFDPQAASLNKGKCCAYISASQSYMFFFFLKGDVKVMHAAKKDENFVD